MKITFFVTLFSMLQIAAFSNRIDSLKTVLEKTNTDTGKITVLIDLGDEYQYSNPDSQLIVLKQAYTIATNIKNDVKKADAGVKLGIYYATANDYGKALDYFNVSKNLYSKANDKKGMVDCMINIGISHNYQDNYPTAQVVLENALKLSIEISDKTRIAKSLNNLSMNCSDMGNFDAALKYLDLSKSIYENLKDKAGLANCYGNTAGVYLEINKNDKAIKYLVDALKISESLNDINKQSDFSNNIGLVYENMEVYDKAIEYYEKSLKFAKQAKDDLSIAYSLGNIGNAYSNSGDFVSAEKYLQQCLTILTKLEHKHGLSVCYSSLGIVYGEQNKLKESKEYFLKSLEINKEIGNLSSLVTSYNNLAGLHIKFKEYNPAIEYISKSLQLSEELKMPKSQMFSYQYLFSIYDSLGDYKKAYDYHVLYSTFRDSIFNEQTTQQISEIETKYQTEKKQIEIQKLEKEKQLSNEKIKLQSSENKKQKIAIAAIVAVALLLSIILFFIVKMLRQKRTANIILQQKNEEILAQRDEIAAQRDLATKQRDIISHQQRDITDSIKYAFQIQSAIFPHEEEVRLILKDYFILYKPRDIVSGDFYWVNKFGNKIIVVAADCTGHGVPGAFMSMLGVAFLNDIVNKERITSPSQILNRLREDIILAMKQRGENVKQQDGMDVAAIVIDKEEQTIEFSGANNPLYLIKNEELIETKGDKMPVSIYARMSPFNSHKYSVEPGDLVYIFSDGYADQFGGPNGKKLKYKYFKELLLNNKTKPMSEQKELLAKTFDHWRGEFPQVDDVLVIGIKI